MDIHIFGPCILLNSRQKWSPTRLSIFLLVLEALGRAANRVFSKNASTCG